MIELWQRAPGTFGAVAGFILMPLLWWLQNALLQIILGFSLGFPLGIAHFSRFLSLWTAIPGAIIGAAISQAVSAKRMGRERNAKWHLLISGFVIVGWYSVISTITLWQNWPRPAPGTSLGIVTWSGIEFSWWAFPIFLYFGLANLHKFPLHVALLMLFIGFAMRSKR